MLQTPYEEREKSLIQSGVSVSLAGIGTSVPSTSFSQNEILEALLSQPHLQKKTQALYRRVLSHPSIQSRHFALSSLAEAFETDLDRINQRFEREATKLASEALVRALTNSNLRPVDLDFIVVATCTGYICPGLAARVMERVGLPSRVQYADLVGMGCGGAIPALHQAYNFVKTNPGSNAAVVCVEICSSAFFSNDEPDIVISNALFSDGAAAVILSGQSEKSEAPGSKPTFKGFESLLVPMWREELRFRTEQGRLRNVLGADVPRYAGQTLKNISQTLLRAHGLVPDDVKHWVVHPGGHAVLNELTSALSLRDEQLAASREVLKNHGNMSSASVLFVLEETLRNHIVHPGEWGLLASFGAGFSAFVSLVRF